METVHCEDFSVTTINVVNRTDLNKVVDAEEELNNLVTCETPNTVVLALANILTASIVTRSGKKLSDVCMNEDLWWCMLKKLAVTVLSPRAKSRFERLLLDLVKLT